MTEQLSSAQMNSCLAEWLVLTNKTKNESFNSSDGSAFTWGKFWPKMAEWFGVEYRHPDTSSDAKYDEEPTPFDPPPGGFGSHAIMRTRFRLAEWAKRPEVSHAWREIAEKHCLIEKELQDPDRVFAFTDNSLMWSWPSNFRYATPRFFPSLTYAIEC